VELNERAVSKERSRGAGETSLHVIQPHMLERVLVQLVW
jgi:hypothetical protein